MGLGLWSERLCPRIQVGVFMLKALEVIRSWGRTLMNGAKCSYLRGPGELVCLYFSHMSVWTECFSETPGLWVP